MWSKKHSPISLPLVALSIFLVTCYVDAEHFYPKCFTPSGATKNPKARGRCNFHCPLDMKHTVCGTDGKHYHNECFLCRHACVKVTLSKACDGPCPCKGHKLHVGRQAVHHNVHHLRHGQVHHQYHANGKKRKMRRKIYKLRKGKKYVRRKKVYKNHTMRHHKKHTAKQYHHGNYHGHGMKRRNGHPRIIRKKVRNMHQRMQGHRVIVRNGGVKGKHVYTNHRNIQKMPKHDKQSWLNSLGFGKSIQQWSHHGNDHRNHNAFAKIPNTRFNNGRAGRRTVYKISKKGGYKKHKAYKRKTKKPRGKRYGFFKKRMLRSRRRRKRKLKHVKH